MARWHVHISLLSLPWLILISLATDGHTGRFDRLPFWTEQAMFRVGDDVFFVGQASCAANAEEGRQRAYEAALQEIKNFTRASKISGFPIETQMVFEEPRSPDCPPGRSSVWRLLRVPRVALESLAKRTRPQDSPSALSAPPEARAVPDLTPRVGMLHDEILSRFGQPHSIWTREGSRHVVWEYPQFGLTLELDRNDALESWSLAGARKDGHAVRALLPAEKIAPKGGDGPTIDLTERLRQLEGQQEANNREAARRYCMIRFPGERQGDKRDLADCVQREYERLERTRRMAALPPTSSPSTTPVVIPTTANFRLVEVMLRADPFSYDGPCPVTITFSGRISAVGGSGMVSYKFLRSDGASAPIQTLQFDTPVSKNVRGTWTLGGPGMTYSGWQALQVFDPQELKSNQATFTIHCHQ